MRGQQIADVRQVVVGNPWKNWVFVCVETVDGIVGLGEATLGVSTLPVLGALEELRPIVLGEDALQIEPLWSRMDEAWYLPGDPVHLAAMSAIEIACWDIAGKEAGVPLHTLLGGTRTREVPVYLNGWYRGDRQPDVFAELAAIAIANGHTGLKLDPFGSGRRTLSNEEFRRSIELVAAVRDAVGSDVSLMIDAHDRFDVPTAVRISKELAELQVAWFEAPVLSDNLDAIAAVVADSPIPIAVGERFTRTHQFASLARVGVGVWQPETLAVGGVRGMREIAALAVATSSSLAPHNARGPVCTAVNLHLAAALQEIAILEYFSDGEDIAARVTAGLSEPVNGRLGVPGGPGHGVSLDEQAALSYPASSENVLRLFRPGWEQRAGETRR